MSSGVSPVGIVRIIVIFLHKLFVGDSGDEEPEGSSDEDSLPHGVRNLVPHLHVQQVDLLNASDVVDFVRTVSEAPDSKIVHMSHLGPVVLEFDIAVLNDLILIKWLLVISGRLEHLLEVLARRFHVF